MEISTKDKRYNARLAACYGVSLFVLFCLWVAVLGDGGNFWMYAFVWGYTGIILVIGFICSLCFLNRPFSWVRAAYLLGLLAVYWPFFGYMIPRMERMARSDAQGALVYLFGPIQINFIILLVYGVIALLANVAVWCWRRLHEKKTNHIENLKK